MGFYLIIPLVLVLISSVDKISTSYDSPVTPWEDIRFAPAPEIQNLIQAAQSAKENAYCPYSNFRVGAALLCKNGNVFTGVNVENASHGLGLCAERTVVGNAVTEGYTYFTAIAIASDVVDTFQAPCGACRQVLTEFGQDWDLYLTKPDLTWKKVCVRELLPMAFTPASLSENRVTKDT